MGGGITQDRKLRHRHQAAKENKTGMVRELRAEVANLTARLAERDIWKVETTADPLAGLGWLGKRLAGLKLFFLGRV